MSDLKLFVDLGLPSLPLLSEKDAAYLDMQYAYFAIQRLAQATGQQLGLQEPLQGFEGNLAYTVGQQKRRAYFEASEDISYGQLINIWVDGGVRKYRLADATDNTKPCHAISNSQGTIAAGGTVEGVLPGAYVNSVSGLTAGVTYYLAAGVPGGGSSVRPATSGNIVQALGFAFSATEFFFNPSALWLEVP